MLVKFFISMVGDSIIRFKKKKKHKKNLKTMKTGLERNGIQSDKYQNQKKRVLFQYFFSIRGMLSCRFVTNRCF